MQKLIPNQLAVEGLLLLTFIGLATAIRLPPGINPKLYTLPEHVPTSPPLPLILRQYGIKPAMVRLFAEQLHIAEEQSILSNVNIEQERAHIQEHIPVPIDTSLMNDDELQFHYFKMHDLDENDKLDGCELIKSLIHWHEEDNKQHERANPKILTDEEMAPLIDTILEMDDTSGDGYIDYPEFIKSQEKKRKHRHRPVYWQT